MARRFHAPHWCLQRSIILLSRVFVCMTLLSSLLLLRHLNFWMHVFLQVHLSWTRIVPPNEPLKNFNFVFQSPVFAISKSMFPFLVHSLCPKLPFLLSCSNWPNKTGVCLAPSYLQLYLLIHSFNETWPSYFVLLCSLVITPLFIKPNKYRIRRTTDPTDRLPHTDTITATIIFTWQKPPNRSLLLPARPSILLYFHFDHFIAGKRFERITVGPIITNYLTIRFAALDYRPSPSALLSLFSASSFPTNPKCHSNAKLVATNSMPTYERRFSLIMFRFPVFHAVWLPVHVEYPVVMWNFFW